MEKLFSDWSLVGAPEKVLVVSLFLVFVFAIGFFFYQWGWDCGGQAAISSVMSDRKKEKLISTRKNITGRISNALQDGLKNNLQWGNRLVVDVSANEIQSTINVFLIDYGFNHKQLVAKIVVVSMSEYQTLLVVAYLPVKSDICVSDPNDSKLTGLIGDQLDFIEYWSPTPTGPKMVA
jgi:hypothetical protein